MNESAHTTLIKLTEQAQHLLHDAIVDDDYLAKVDSYLELCAVFIQQVPPGEVTDETFRKKFAELLTFHQQIVARAETEKNHVSDEITELKRKSSVTRAYLNLGPSRVTITGKRQG
jgi:oligoribonuclease NrnB/cAMP/cGMP phosphodiesterase (DHH superfamily)